MKLDVMMPKLQMSALKYLVVIVIMSLAYCSFKPGDNSMKDKMTAKQALIAAIEYFPAKDNIESYEIAISEAGDNWNVTFTQYRPARVPGAHFIIAVPKVRGELKLLRGE